MNKFIEVHDDILPLWLIDKIEYTLTNENSNIFYKYKPSTTFSSNHPNYSFSPGISHIFFDPTLNYFSPQFNIFMQVLYTFAYKRKILIEECYSGRSFLDFPSFKPNEPVLPAHTDLNFPHWVCLYYANDTEGDTIFFDENKKEIKRVQPKKGRIIFFDGNIKHTGSSSVNTVRALVNFNFLGKKQ